MRVHRNAIADSRRLKPEIPLTGENGIPIRDEIELEIIFRKGTNDLARCSLAARR